jgi:hypothetical protein
MKKGDEDEDDGAEVDGDARRGKGEEIVLADVADSAPRLLVSWQLVRKKKKVKW